MADQILTNGSNIARKNKITLKVDGVELGIIISFKNGFDSAG